MFTTNLLGRKSCCLVGLRGDAGTSTNTWFVSRTTTQFLSCDILLHTETIVLTYICTYICYVQVEILYKLQLVQISCTSCNLYKQLVQVPTNTSRLVQVATCTDFGPVQVATCTSSTFYQMNNVL